MLGEREITSLPPHRVVAAGIGYVPQTSNVFTTLTIHENLKVGGHTLRRELAAPLGRADATREGGGHTLRSGLAARLERAYALFPVLAQKRRQPGRALSGGQRQMLAI